MFPLLFILIGNFIDRLIHNFPRGWKFVAAITLIFLLGYQFAFDVRLITFIKQKQCIRGDYGPPYAYRVKKIEEIIHKQGIPQSQEQFRKLHEAAIYCSKCDVLATIFILKNLNGDLSPKQ
ncbi:MAG: hypothetical protein A2161_03860 [Candidatus Schekmanbacteria bacterium RBG_13_48_7]|uniref:Uncharacterized protein n=1 Tax=Candidatus Schekmanbacteria bacterium RBG_13_48_7 TaxID=1817878 RepID=A0A1F7RZI9_9BACT|nr:MAG: hypothetical protein A2161_03860 [Candidatus Schekmanbacteria bacterium RBG_13_48_7]